MKTYIFLIFSILLTTLKLLASDSGTLPLEESKPKTPNIRFIREGQDTLIDFQDGRVAGFFQSIGKVMRTHIGLSQTENTCNFQQILSNCKLEVDMASLEVSVRWVKHTDPTKINQILKYRINRGNNEIEENSLKADSSLFWYNTIQEKTYAKLMKPDRLVCNNLDFLNTLPIMNARLKIDSWSTESSTKNLETKNQENQSSSNVYDVILKKKSENTLEFESFGKAYSAPVLPPYISIQTASLTYIDRDQKQCLVSFESSPGDVIKAVSDPYFKSTDLSTLAPLRQVNKIKQSSVFSFVVYIQKGYFTGVE